MPSWNEVLSELQEANAELQKYNQDNSPLDKVRRSYIKKLSDLTGRNVICYYSGWLQKPGFSQSAINDDDKNGFMATIHNLDRTKGLDLILHTPGGDVAATESIVDYLRKMFGDDIRVIVPQIAMSAGTMIACAAKKVVLGKQSNIGPIDPQLGGIPAHGVVDEFNRAKKEITSDPSTLPLWQQIVGKYHPTFLGACEHAIQLSNSLVHEWLITGMLKNMDDADAAQRADEIVTKLNNYTDTKTHSRHIHAETAKEIGLIVENLEDDPNLQDLVLTVHHSFQHTLASSSAIKIIENQLAQAIIINVKQEG